MNGGTVLGFLPFWFLQRNELEITSIRENSVRHLFRWHCGVYVGTNPSF
uniref:Uncharacterized protein n=1 Tax=Arundo donax TaxID=35708 RepID=A0A0A9GWR8_ARUDO